jgi:poly-gamma-glutamate capsule biosynthesis protein CapA/YwtB (metallophosphatase superfamily)
MRAGAVVVVAGFLFSLVIDGAPRPIEAKAASAETRKPAAKPASPPAQSAAADSVVTIAAVGDIVMGSTPNLPPDGGRAFFDGVSADLSGDVVLGNLEGTLSRGGRSKCRKGSSDCYSFQTPPKYARLLKQAGFTVMNLANNHAFDYGASGQAQTLAALARHGLHTTGRPGEVAIERVGEVDVALVGFASYPWAQSLTNIPAARKLVRKAARTADVVIVTMHAGAEGTEHTHTPKRTEMFLGENRGNVIAFSHAVVDAGADLVVGHGPHVLRGMEWYRGRLIAYSLGNFAGYKVFALGGPLSISGILRVTLRGNGTYESGLLVATRLAGLGIPSLDPTGAAHGVVRQLSSADFGARAVKVGSNGGLGR